MSDNNNIQAIPAPKIITDENGKPIKPLIPRINKTIIPSSENKPEVLQFRKMKHSKQDLGFIKNPKIDSKLTELINARAVLKEKMNNAKKAGRPNINPVTGNVEYKSIHQMTDFELYELSQQIKDINEQILGLSEPSIMARYGYTENPFKLPKKYERKQKYNVVSAQYYYKNKRRPMDNIVFVESNKTLVNSLDLASIKSNFATEDLFVSFVSKMETTMESSTYQGFYIVINETYTMQKIVIIHKSNEDFTSNIGAYFNATEIYQKYIS